MNLRFSNLLFACVAASLSVASSVAQGQAYPSRLVKIIVPFAAGSTTDTLARVVAEELRTSMNGTFIVENRPGAAGQIGCEFVARSPADGYTLVISSSSTHSASTALFKKLPYDPLKDFTPISRFAQIPFVLMTNPSVPAKSLKEFVDFGRANPDKLSYAYGTPTSQIIGATLGEMTSIKALPVPYKSQPQAVTDLLSGQVQFMVADIAVGLPYIKSGRLNALAVVTSTRRLEQLPEVPTLSEAGFPGFDISPWVGLSGPAGLPVDIAQRLNENINKSLEKIEIKTRLANLGMESFPGSLDDVRNFIVTQATQWGKRAQAARIQPE